MNIDKQIADQIRQLSDKALAEMALNSGFSIQLKKPLAKANGTPPSTSRETPPAKKKRAPKEIGLDHPYYKVLARLQTAGKAGLGMSTSELVGGPHDGMAKSDVVKGLKVGLDKGTIFKGGERRFTRYSDEQKIADDASVAARGG